MNGIIHNDSPEWLDGYEAGQADALRGPVESNRYQGRDEWTRGYWAGVREVRKTRRECRQERKG